MSTKTQATAAAKKDEATKSLSEEQKKTVVIPMGEQPKQEPQKAQEQAQKISVDMVLAHLWDKVEVAKKMEYLKEQKKLLNAFTLGDDRMRTTVVLRDSAGNEWKTSNAVLLHQIFDVCKTVVDQKIKDAEAELLAA